MVIDKTLGLVQRYTLQQWLIIGIISTLLILLIRYKVLPAVREYLLPAVNKDNSQTDSTEKPALNTLVDNLYTAVHDYSISWGSDNPFYVTLSQLNNLNDSDFNYTVMRYNSNKENLYDALNYAEYYVFGDSDAISRAVRNRIVANNVKTKKS